MKHKPQTMFAAVSLHDRRHVLAWTIAGYAQTVRQIVGKSWDDADPETGWKAARKDGMRIVKVEVKVVR